MTGMIVPRTDLVYPPAPGRSRVPVGPGQGGIVGEEHRL
jgi:hypothetical protein